MRSTVRIIIAIIAVMMFITALSACGTSEEPVSDSVSESVSAPAQNSENEQIAAEPSSQEPVSEDISETEEPNGIYLLSKGVYSWGTETYEYDPSGRMTATRYDDGWYTLYEYDERGNLLSEITYDQNGKISKEFLHEYNSKNLVTKETTHFSGSEATVIEYEYTFDETGRTVHIDKTVVNNGNVSTYDYTYDENGNYVIDIISVYGGVSQEKYTADGVMYETTWKGGKSVYTFDDDGRLITGIVYGELGDEVSKNVITYEEGRTIEEVYSYGTLVTSTVHYYDEHGNEIKITKPDIAGKETVVAEKEYVYFIPEE